jgi:hypothetical protein
VPLQTVGFLSGIALSAVLYQWLPGTDGRTLTQQVEVGQAGDRADVGCGYRHLGASRWFH